MDLPPLAPPLRPYEAVLELAAAIGGPGCEAVLHDLSDPLHSVVRVANGSVTGRAAGQGLRHLVPDMLRAQMARSAGGASDLLPVYWHRHEGRLIRSLSLLIRDEKGALAGALCVNQDFSGSEKDLERLGALLAGAPLAVAGQNALPPAGPNDDAQGSRPQDGASDPSESVLETVFAMIDRMAGKALAESAGASGTLPREERLALVRFMETRGVFLVKGAMEHAADRLGISKVTLYSDLDLLRREAAQTANTRRPAASGRKKEDKS